MKKKTNKSIFVITTILLAGIAFLVVKSIGCSKKEDGRWLTDFYKGPLVYQGEVYVCSDLMTFSEEKDTEVLGCVKKNWMDSFSFIKWYKRCLGVQSDIIGDVEDPQRDYIKVRGERDFFFTKVSELEDNGDIDYLIQEYDDFIVQECKQRYLAREIIEEHGVDSETELQRFKISKECVETLRKTYGVVEIVEEDFNHNNETYLLMAGDIQLKSFIKKYFGGYRIPNIVEDAQAKRLQPYFFVGIIFLEDEKLYYGNYNNEITGELYDIIMDGICQIKAVF